jgi:hypothetical protein
MSDIAVRRAATSQQQLIGNVIAGLFALLGIGIIAVLILSIVNNPAIAQAESTNRLILDFLDGYGILIPVLVIGLGFTFIDFARKLYARDIVASGWAQLSVFWMMVFSIILILIHLFQVLTNNIGANPENLQSLNMNLVVGLAVLAAIAGVAWWWLTMHRDAVFKTGQETIASRESLVAWNLLLPTVVILILIAARPLERTFIGSLTDRTFAGAADQEVHFIGVQNYTNLLGFRVDKVDCVRNEANECTTQTISNEIENVDAVPVNLDSIAALEPAGLDVGLDFFQPATLNNLLASNESFATALAAAAKAALEEETGTPFDDVQVVQVVEGNLVEVTSEA